MIKDSTPSVETKIKTKVHWLKVRQIKCAPTTNIQISIGVRYDVSSAFTNVVIGNLPKETRAARRRDLILPQISEDRLPVSKALHKVSLLKVLINLLILKVVHLKKVLIEEILYIVLMLQQTYKFD